MPADSLSFDTGNDPLLFQPLDPLGHRRLPEGHASTELRKRDAAVLLHRFENGEVLGVEIGQESYALDPRLP